MDPAQWHSFLRTAHIGLGSVALILFWVPLFARKGGRTHIVSGSALNIVAYAVAGTAAISCVWAIAAPISFSGITRELSKEETDILSANIRFLFTVLFTLMTWLVAGIKMGRHVIREKSDLRVRNSVPRLLWRIALITSIGVGLFGLHLLVAGNLDGILQIFLCWVGVSDSRENLRVLTLAPKSPTIWIEKHIESVIGVGIGLYTAFFVFGFSKISGIELSGTARILPWLIPAAIGVPATKLLCKKYRRLNQSREIP